MHDGQNEGGTPGPGSTSKLSSKRATPRTQSLAPEEEAQMGRGCSELSHDGPFPQGRQCWGGNRQHEASRTVLGQRHVSPTPHTDSGESCPVGGMALGWVHSP